MAEPDDFIEDTRYDYLDPNDLERREQDQLRQAELPENEMVKYLERLQRAYQNVFSTGNTNQHDLDIVLNDLQRFCRMQHSTFNPNDGPHAATLRDMKEGRREVFLRIKDYSRLSLDTLILKLADAITPK